MAIKPFKQTGRGRLLKECRAIAAKLQLPPEVESKSVELLGKAVKLGVASGRKPSSATEGINIDLLNPLGEQLTTEPFPEHLV